MYRPPLTPFWRKKSIYILSFLLFCFSSFVLLLFFQKKEEVQKMNLTTSGILIDKRDLDRGDFLLIMNEHGNEVEYVLSGYSLFYDKFVIGDSLIKFPGSFKFRVFRKSMVGNYEYVYTTGY